MRSRSSILATRSFAQNAQDFGRRLPRAENGRSRLLIASSQAPLGRWYCA
jgi:hypothetical protein